MIPWGPDLWSEIEPAWVALLERTGEKSAFLSATWVGCWLESFGAGLQTAALVWTDEPGEVVGCVLVSMGSGRFGPFRVSRAFLNASGDGGVGCEHNDVLVVPEHRDQVLDGLVAFLCQSKADEVALVGVREGTFEELLSRWPRKRWQGHRSESPYVCLSRIRAEGGTYLSEVSSNTRSQIRRSIRRYRERFGEETVEVASSPDQAAVWFSEMVTLHEERWHAKGELGAFASEAVRGFHDRLIARAVGGSGDGGLSVDLVRVRFGEETIAIFYSLVRGGNVHFYQSGIQYHEDARFKPGLVAHSLVIEYCLERGDDEYDFLGGEAKSVQYKRSLATDTRILAWIELQAPNVKMAVMDALRRCRSHFRTSALTDMTPK